MKNRKELIDYDPAFIKNLKKNHPEEYRYLAQFTDEYAHANIRKTPDKTGIKKGYIHNTPELYKSVSDANNWRNNDVLLVSKNNGIIASLTSKLEKTGFWVTNSALQEDAACSKIDNDRELLLNNEVLSLNFKEFYKLKDRLIPKVRAMYDKLFAVELENKKLDLAKKVKKA